MDPEPESAVTRVNLSGYAHLLRTNANFRRLWMAQIISEIGDWFYTLAIYTLLLQLTGQARSVALALVLQVLPQTFIGPAAGVVNDRIRRKHVMITADLARMAIVLAMLFVRSRSTVWLVYPLLLLETMMAAFFEPARSSVIPNITTREDLVLANTLSSTTWSMNLVLGATLGGVVGALLGRNAVFVMNAGSFLISALLIRGMRFQEPHAESSRPLRLYDLVDLSPIVEGIRYVRRDARLLATVFVKAGMFVIGPGWVVFTVMGQRDFPVRWGRLSPQRGAMLGMSLLLGARGLGALVGPLVAAPGDSAGIFCASAGLRGLGGRQQIGTGLPVRRVRAFRRLNHLGIFNHLASTQHGRSLSGTGICRRPWFLHVYDRCRSLSGRTFRGLGRSGKDGGERGGVADAGAGLGMGVDDAELERDAGEGDFSS